MIPRKPLTPLELRLLRAIGTRYQSKFGLGGGLKRTQPKPVTLPALERITAREATQ